MLLQGLEKQDTIEQAVYDNYGVPLDMLEQTWKKGLIKGEFMDSVLADHMYWLLFFLAALITIAGYCVVKRRMRNYRDEEDEAGQKRKAKSSPAMDEMRLFYKFSMDSLKVEGL